MINPHVENLEFTHISLNGRLAAAAPAKTAQERGITLDLGFSSFVTDAPEHIQASGWSLWPFTLQIKRARPAFVFLLQRI